MALWGSGVRISSAPPLLPESEGLSHNPHFRIVSHFPVYLHFRWVAAFGLFPIRSSPPFSGSPSPLLYLLSVFGFVVPDDFLIPAFDDLSESTGSGRSVGTVCGVGGACPLFLAGRWGWGGERLGMKAAVLYGREDIRIESVAERSLDAGEVRVRIGAALTCGTDLKVYRRGYHARMLTPPCVFGHELAGTVVEVAPDVAGWIAGIGWCVRIRLRVARVNAVLGAGESLRRPPFPQWSLCGVDRDSGPDREEESSPPPPGNSVRGRRPHRAFGVCGSRDSRSPATAG